MRGTTTIDDARVTFLSNDETMQGIDFVDNKKIKFLPLIVVDMFPNLLVYKATFCSIKGIFKTNLKFRDEKRKSALEKWQSQKSTRRNMKDAGFLEVSNFFAIISSL